MPPLGKADLLERICSSFAIAGYRCLHYETSEVHPFRLATICDSAVNRVIAYIWNCTHGGGVERPSDEYRIQLTGVAPPLMEQDGWVTLLLGWREEENVFAAFDPQLHRQFSTRSPSIQIKQGTLAAADANGIAFQDKGSGEVAVAFRPDFLAFYVEHQRDLHASGQDAEALEALQTISEMPDGAASVGPQPMERQQVLSEIRRWRRSSAFRQRIMIAYGKQCALCAQQLDMTIAAHIIPVSEPDSTDETSNGLALCPDHHEAYDSGLVGVFPDFTVSLNEDRIRRLRAQGLDGGLEAFQYKLRADLLLPPSDEDRPRPDYLTRGLQLRGWSGDLSSLRV